MTIQELLEKTYTEGYDAGLVGAYDPKQEKLPKKHPYVKGYGDGRIDSIRRKHIERE